MKRVLIIGANSPIARVIHSQLEGTSLKLMTVSHDESLNGSGSGFNIASPESVRSLLQQTQPDTVLHFAMQPQKTLTSEEFIGLNATFGASLAASATEYGCRTLLFASSAAIYGDKNAEPLSEISTPNPLSPYARMKLATEHALAEASKGTDLSVSSLRMFNVYGTGMQNSLVNKLKSWQFCKPHNIHLFGRENFVRDYVNVLDVASVFVELLTNRISVPPVLNIGTNRGISSENLYNMLPERAQEKIVFQHHEYSYSVASTKLLQSITSRKFHLLSSADFQ